MFTVDNKFKLNQQVYVIQKETKRIEKLPKPEPPVNPDNSYEYIMGTSVYSADHLASFAVSQLGGDTSKVSLYCSGYS